MIDLSTITRDEFRKLYQNLELEVSEYKHLKERIRILEAENIVLKS